MARLILSLLGILAVSEAALIKQYWESKIVGGEDAKLGEIPYQVLVQFVDEYCGGSILNDRYVITAAHCCKGKNPPGTIITSGVVDLSQTKMEHEAEKFIIHEKYNPADSYVNDICLIKVKQPFVESEHVKYVTLPSKDENINGGDVAVISGWGSLYHDGPSPDILQKVNVFIASPELCKERYAKIHYRIHATQICAFDPNETRGSCQGDSGGPMTVNGKIVGLVSFAVGCGNKHYPSVLTRVSSYLDWIKTNAV